MDALELKSHLEAIKANGYSAEGVDVPAIVEAMLTHIGDTEPILREELIYITLARWMPDVIDPVEMRRMLMVLLDDRHLFYCIGEQGTDTVFTRTFSLLAIALILYHHRETPFLSADNVAHVLTSVSKYAVQEQDLRGYTGEEKWWAHAIAHLADVLDELALCEEMTDSALLMILDSVKHTMSTSRIRYNYDEDERMAYATLSLFERGLLSPSESKGWIRSLAEPAAEWKGWSEAIHFQRANLKQYLRSLYFQATHKNQSLELLPTIIETHQQITSFK